MCLISGIQTIIKTIIMQRLALPPAPGDIPRHGTENNEGIVKPITYLKSDSSNNKPTRPGFWAKLFPSDAAENLTDIEAAIRLLCLLFFPWLSYIDWTYHTYFMIFLAPILFYLEVTAFTLTCPVKRLFSNYTQAPKVE